MSGHSKWSSIKHKKAAADAKRGKIFTKLIRAITVAAREGGGDLDANPPLRLAVDKARAANMPKDTVERAIKRGTGDLEGVSYEQVSYEGYGPGGVAIIVEVLTDNRNRTVSEIRHLFAKSNGNLGQDGCVAWMFDVVGQVVIPADSVADEDHLMMLALEGGADDVDNSEGDYVVTCPPETLRSLKNVLIDNGYTEIDQAEVTKVPKNTVKIDGKEAEQVLRLLTALEEHDDVEQVSANCDIDDEILEQFG